jgi:hypothetical protein
MLQAMDLGEGGGTWCDYLEDLASSANTIFVALWQR